jgi:hypothetical protein
MGGNGVENNGTVDTTIHDYLAEDVSLRAPYNNIREHWNGWRTNGDPKKRRWIGQREPEARDIPVTMHIRESEVKTREVELETREAELKDRQAAMLIRLDEQERLHAE